MTIFQEVEAFAKSRGIAVTDISRAMGEKHDYIAQIKYGRIAPTPERCKAIRDWMAANPNYATERLDQRFWGKSGTGIDVSMNPDLWEEDAERASAMLLSALRQHHPNRCAA